MIRRIIQIDEEKCNGCGACARCLPRGALSEWWTEKRSFSGMIIVMVWATVSRPAPWTPISFVEREAAAYDEEAVKAAQEAARAQNVQGSDSAADSNNSATTTTAPLPCGCPGSNVKKN